MHIKSRNTWYEHFIFGIQVIPFTTERKDVTWDTKGMEDVFRETIRAFALCSVKHAVGDDVYV